MKTLEQTQDLVQKREQAVRLYFQEGVKGYTEIANRVGTTKQNVHNWIKAELAARKKK